MDILREKKVDGPRQRFGRYVVVRALGKGAMGEVYLAHDPVLDRKVALKVIAIDPSLDRATREEYFKRFSYEAQASARLNHPSIVAVYDAGEHNGLPWIAFQYVEGETLEKLLGRRGNLPIKRCMAFALDIASALEHAHGWKIVHRDVKPANILIESSTGIAKLADFGIVKAPWAAMTQEGDTLGSPGYMSPEQIDGAELDERADIFCLGVVLYQMISGKHPFLRDTVSSTAYATCSGAYAPLREVASNVPPALDWAVRKCLAIDRRKRTGSAAELISMLKTVPAHFGGLGKYPTGKNAAKNLIGIAKRGMRPPKFVMRIIPALKKADRPRWATIFFRGSLAGISVIVCITGINLFMNSPSLPKADSVEGRLVKQCTDALEKNNRDAGLEASTKLSSINPLYPQSLIVLARIMIREGRYDDAANALNRIIQLKGGKKTLKKERMKILLEICRQMKKGPAPAPLLDLTAFALFADGRRLVRSWITDTNHWLRWNAVEVLKMSNMEVDMVPVYIQDLSFAGSVQARIAAVDRLGEIGDKRAIPALKKVKALDQNDPLVSMEAGKILDEKFK